MGFDFTPETPHLVLKLAASPLEGVIQGEKEVGVTFIGVRGAGRVDFLSRWQSQPDIDFVKASRLMVAAGPGSDEAAGTDTSKSFFEKPDMLLDRSLLAISWCKALEVNFYGCLHNLLLKLEPA
jgi:hypothetical protein